MLNWNGHCYLFISIIDMEYGIDTEGIFFYIYYFIASYVYDDSVNVQAEPTVLFSIPKTYLAIKLIYPSIFIPKLCCVSGEQIKRFQITVWKICLQSTEHSRMCSKFAVHISCRLKYVLCSLHFRQI